MMKSNLSEYGRIEMKRNQTRGTLRTVLPKLWLNYWLIRNVS